jgi:hypothetical protein
MQITLPFFLISLGLSMNVVLFVLLNALMITKYREQEGKLCVMAGFCSIIVGMNIIFLIVSLMKFLTTN